MLQNAVMSQCPPYETCNLGYAHILAEMRDVFSLKYSSEIPEVINSLSDEQKIRFLEVNIEVLLSSLELTKKTLKQFLWVNVQENPPKNGTRVLAYCKANPTHIYHLSHQGWYMNTIYACFITENKFLIESHGPEIPATHYMYIPEPPK